MSYRLGIDLGTTFTAAAVLRDGAGPEAVRLGERALAAPSVVYLAPDGSVLFGEAAEDRAPDAPERIARHFKLRIGDEVPLVLGTSAADHVECYADDLYAAMIAWVVATVTGREGIGPDAVVLTHPAAWNRRKLDLLATSLAAQNLPPITLITEPEAAAIGYASTGLIPHPATLAVYDLGGGTLDVALLDTTADSRFVRRSAPAGLESLGGIDFDDAILRHVLTAVDAASWAAVDADQMTPEVRRALARLRTASVAAKEILSTETTASVSVSIDGTLTEVPLDRADFDALINAMVDQSTQFFSEVISAAGLDADDLSAVLLTGGSVQVPLVAEMLSEALPAHVRLLRAVDPKAMVAAGAVLSLRAGSAESAGVVPAARTARAGRPGADFAIAQAREFFGADTAPGLPTARDGAAADLPVAVAAGTAPAAASTAIAAAPAPVRTARTQERPPTEMPARPAGHSFFDKPPAEDTAKIRPGNRRGSVLTRIGVLVLLAAAVAGGASYWDQAKAPSTERATTRISRTAEVVKAELKAARKPAPKKAQGKAEQAAASTASGR